MQQIIKHWLFWISLIFIFLSITAFLWRDWQFSFSSTINSEKFGQFGNFLSGTIGTLFAGISLILVIITIHIQNKNLEMSKKNNDFNFINYSYDRISKEIDDTKHSEYKGIEAFYKFELDPDKNINFLDSLNLVLTTYDNLFSAIINDDTIEELLKNQAKERFYLLYYTKILWPLHETIIKNGHKFINGLHDDSKLIIPKYARLALECINYLLKKELVAKSDWKEEKIKNLNSLIN